MKVTELLEQLQEAVKEGYGDAKVYVRSEGFTLYDHEAEDEVSFGSVPCTGVEEMGHGTGIPPYVVIGREDPDDLVKRLCETPRWSMPLADGESELAGGEETKETLPGPPERKERTPRGEVNGPTAGRQLRQSATYSVLGLR